MANQNITLKRVTSSGTDVLYPATIGERIVSGTIHKDRLPSDIPVSKLDGVISTSNLPAIAVANVTVHNNTFSNFLTTYNDTSGNLEGDIVIATTDNESYIHNGGTAGGSGDWTLLATPDGDITAVTASTGLTGGGTTGSVSLAVNFAGTGSANTVARSDHNHDSTYKATFSENTAFNRDFAGSGSANTVARSDHNHNSLYLGFGGGTLTGDLTMQKDGSTLVGSHGVVFGYNNGSNDLTRELNVTAGGALQLGGKTVNVIENTNMGRVFYDTTAGTAEGDIIFDVV